MDVIFKRTHERRYAIEARREHLADVATRAPSVGCCIRRVLKREASRTRRRLQQRGERLALEGRE